MIREAIKTRIKDLDITQKKLAEAMGVQPQNLSTFTTGLRWCPYDKFISLMTLLGLTVGRNGSYVGRYAQHDIRSEIRASIEASGLSRKEIAAKSGVNYSTLSSFLTGKRTLRLPTLEKLMVSLNLGLVCFGEPQIVNDKSTELSQQ